MTVLSRVLRSLVRRSTTTSGRRRRFSSSLLPCSSSALISSTAPSPAPWSSETGVPSGPPPSPSPSFASATCRPLNTKASSSDDTDDCEEDPFSDEVDEEEQTADEWEEEDEEEAAPKLGDGGDGGGIVLNNVVWGEQVLEIARQVLSQFDDDVELYAFKATPRGYIYVRIDKLSNKYGCPSMEEIEGYSQEYKKRLDEAGALGEIPKNLALEVSSPGAERLLKVPDELSRFQDMPMRVSYVDDGTPAASNVEKTGVFFLESVETDTGRCVWKLADVKENRDLHGKGRGLSRKQKDYRLELPYGNCRMATLYLDY